MKQHLGAASRQYESYLKIHKTGAKGLNLKDWGRVLGWVCIVGSLVFWVPASWVMAAPIDSPVTGLIATAFGFFMAIGAPVIVSIFVPGTRAGQLLLKLNMLTLGKLVALGVGLFLLFHAYEILHTWWSQHAAGAMGMDIQMAILGVIFTIIAPALLFEPVSREELHAELETAHQTQIYEIAAKARINMYLKGQQEAESLMAQGLHNLNPTQLRVVRGYITGFAAAVDETHRAWAAELKQATGRALPYRAIGGDPRTMELLSFIDQLMAVQGFDLDATDQALDHYVARSLDGGPDQRLAPLPAPAMVAAASMGGTTVHSGPQRSATAATTVAPDGETDEEGESRLLDTAWAALRGKVWTRQHIEQALSIKRSKANALIADWRAQGLVAEDDGAKFHYYFNEEQP